MNDNYLPAVPDTGIEFFQTEDGRTRISVRFQNETVWPTQRLMAELFQVSVLTINEHIKGIFAEGELVSEATIRSFRIIQPQTHRGR